MRGFIIFLEVILDLFILPIVIFSMWEDHSRRLVSDGDEMLAADQQAAYKVYSRACDFPQGKDRSADLRVNLCRKYGIGVSNELQVVVGRTWDNPLSAAYRCEALISSLAKTDVLSDDGEKALWEDAKDLKDIRPRMCTRLTPLAQKSLLWAQLALADAYETGNGMPQSDHDAFVWYLKAAEAGDMTAITKVVQFYRDGIGTEKNLNAMVVWLKKTVDAGNRDSEYQLAVCYDKGRGVAKDPVMAAEWYRKAASHDHPEACAHMARTALAQPTNALPGAIEWLQKGADAGDAFCQSKLGVFYSEGTGVVKNVNRAFQLFLKAADQGDLEAEFRLGLCYCDGDGVVANAKSGFDKFERAANKGHVVAQRMVGVCYDEGIGVKQDKVAAFRWYLRAAENGDAVSEGNVGMCYAQGEGVQENIEQAVKWLQKAVDDGNTAAKGMLGLYYLKGEGGLTADAVKAAALIKDSAEQGDVFSQFIMGGLYLNGKGVEKNVSKAFSLYLKAANKGLAAAQHEVGECYFSGVGVEKDQRAAFGWYKKAAEKDNAQSQAAVAFCYLIGAGVSKDTDETYNWAKKSADQEDPFGQFMMGVCYEHGYGRTGMGYIKHPIVANRYTALQWYRKAHAQGFTEAKKCIDRLSRLAF